jgi:6-phosphogluconolactonase
MSVTIKPKAIVAAIAAIISISGAQLASAATVYTETNRVAGNEVQTYHTSYDGSLVQTGSIATGGRGTDNGLGSQGAVVLTRSGRLLFAVNAGSDDVSAFAVTPRGLVWVDRIASGGSRPISLTVHADLLYVLNAGGEGNIAGFRIMGNGRLKAIPGSIKPLSSSNAAPAQIEFDREGDVLVVTEKATNRISVYGIEDDLPVGPTALPSVGATPFGFEFDRHNNLLVSEAFGGAAGASALSSYDLDMYPLALETISGSVPTNQTAACWVVPVSYTHLTLPTM